MTIDNANSHPFKVEVVEGAEMYANSHPYQVEVVGGSIGGGEARVVDQLPTEGENGVIYLVVKEHTAQGDVYNEYVWALQQDGETYDWELLGSVTINNNSITGHGAPTSSTEASSLGQTYIDLDTQEMYYCSNIDNGIYTWRKLATEETPTDWGYFEYYTDVTESYEPNGDNVEINNFNVDTYKQFLLDNELDDWVDFMYEEDWDPETGEPTGEYIWRCWGPEDEIKIRPEDMYSTTGIDVTVVDPEMGFANVMVEYTKEVDTTGPVEIYNITSEEEYEALGSSEEMRGPFGEVGMLWQNQFRSYTFPNRWIGYTPQYFMYLCANLTGVYSEYEQSDEAGNYFYYLPVEKFGDYFCASCTQLNCDIFLGPKEIGSNVKIVQYTIDFGEYFLHSCTNFDGQFGLCDYRCVLKIEEIPNGFMYDCSQFTGQLLGSSWFTDVTYLWNDNCGAKKIGDNFLAYTQIGQNRSFYIQTSLLEYIGNVFLSGVQNFTLTMTCSNLTHIGDHFLSDVQNSTLIMTCPKLAYIGSSFLANAVVANVNIDAPSLTVVGERFCYYLRASSYLRLTMPNVGYIKGNFLLSANVGSLRINSQVDNVVNFPQVVQVQSQFLYACSGQIDYINLPLAVSIGDYFCTECSNMNAYIHLESLQNAGAQILYNCYQQIRPIYLGSIEANQIALHNATFGVNGPSYPAYTTGMTIVAEHVDEILARFPNRTSNPYRKLINGGTGAGGETYTFSDTETGWKAEDSSGTEVFSHDDKGVSDFDQLTNVPSYNGSPMTSQTNIPEVPTKTSDLTNDGSDGTSTYAEISDLPVALTDAQYEALWTQANILEGLLNNLVGE